MTQTPFKAFKSQVSFTPADNSGYDLIAEADKNQEEMLADVARAHNKLFEYELREAEVKDQRWDKLAKFSTTAAGIAAPILQAQTNEKYMEGAEAWKNDSAKNQQLLMAEFEAEELSEVNEEVINNKAVDPAYKNGEIDVFLKDRLKSLPRRQRTGYLRAMYAEKAEKYPMFLQQNSNIPVNIQLADGTWAERTLKQAEDPNEYKQIERRLYRAYIRPFASLNQAGARKYLYESMNEVEKKFYNQWAQNRQKVLDSNEQEKATGEVLSAIGTPHFGQAYMSYLQINENRHGGSKQTRDYLNKEIKKEIDVGNFAQNELETLGSTMVIDRSSGKPKRFDEVFSRDYRELEQHLESTNIKIINEELRQQESEITEVKVEFNKWNKEKEGPLTDAHVEKWYEIIEAKTGSTQRVPWLENERTKNERDDDADYEHLMQLKEDRGFLIESDLEGMSNATFQKTAHLIKEGEAISGGLKEFNRDADLLIKSYTNTAVFAEGGNLEAKQSTPQWATGYTNAKRDYQQKVARFMRGGLTAEVAHEQALKQLRANFGLNDDGTLKSDYPISNSEASTDSQYFNVREISSEETQLRAIETGQANLLNFSSKEDKLNYLTTTVIPDSVPYLKAGKAYQEGKGDIPHYYKVLASNEPKLTSWDILDAQLKAAGHE